MSDISQDPASIASGQPEPKTRARPSSRRKSPTAAEMAKLNSIRKQLSAARQEVTEAMEVSRDAEARLAAMRMDADALARRLAVIDTNTASIRGSAEAAWIGAGRSGERVEQVANQFAALCTRIEAARSEYAELESETSATLERFRTAVDEMRRAENGELPADRAADLGKPDSDNTAGTGSDARMRLVHLLNDAWSVEKEVAGLLQSMADETEDENVRGLVARQCEDARRRIESAAQRLETMGAHPAGGRGFLAQIAARVWDAVQAPRDPMDRALMTVLKGLSAAEFLVGLYRAVHAAAHAAEDVETKKLAAAQFRELRGGVEAFHDLVARATLAPGCPR